MYPKNRGLTLYSHEIVWFDTVFSWNHTTWHCISQDIDAIWHCVSWAKCDLTLYFMNTKCDCCVALAMRKAHVIIMITHFKKHKTKLRMSHDSTCPCCKGFAKIQVVAMFKAGASGPRLHDWQTCRHSMQKWSTPNNHTQQPKTHTHRDQIFTHTHHPLITRTATG